MNNKSYLEKYNDENSEVVASLNINKRIFMRLIGFLICSIIYFVIYQISKHKGLHDIQTQFVNTFVNSIMTISYCVSFFFIVFYVLYLSVPSFKKSFDKVRFKIKKIFFFVLDWLVILPICATVASFCFAFVFTFAQVDGDSMYPTVYDESTVFVSYIEKVEKYDVVVAYITPEANLISSNEYYIKRVIGVPGDRITWINGVLTINGIIIDEEYLDQETKEFFKKDGKSGKQFVGDFEYKVDGVIEKCKVIPDGYYFIMGDNRTVSNDSRQIGLVPSYNIEGVVKYEFTNSGIERVK